MGIVVFTRKAWEGMSEIVGGWLIGIVGGVPVTSSVNVELLVTGHG